MRAIWKKNNNKQSVITMENVLGLGTVSDPELAHLWTATQAPGADHDQPGFAQWHVQSTRQTNTFRFQYPIFNINFMQMEVKGAICVIRCLFISKVFSITRPNIFFKFVDSWLSSHKSISILLSDSLHSTPTHCNATLNTSPASTLQDCGNWL